MKRRSALKNSIIISAWSMPTINVVVLPVHAMTSVVTYAGIVNVVSTFTILSQWYINVVQLDGTRFQIVLQNTNNTVHLAGEIDEIGPYNTLGVTGSCTEIASGASARITGLDISSISLSVALNVNGGSEVFATTVPVSGNEVAMPPLVSSCSLT